MAGICLWQGLFGKRYVKSCQIILLSSFSWIGAYLGEKVIQEVPERKDIVAVKAKKDI